MSRLCKSEEAFRGTEGGRRKDTKGREYSHSRKALISSLLISLRFAPALVKRKAGREWHKGTEWGKGGPTFYAERRSIVLIKGGERGG